MKDLIKSNFNKTSAVAFVGIVVIIIGTVTYFMHIVILSLTCWGLAVLCGLWLAKYHNTNTT